MCTSISAFLFCSALAIASVSRDKTPEFAISPRALATVHSNDARHVSSIPMLKRRWKSHVATADRLENTAEASTNDDVHCDGTWSILAY